VYFESPAPARLQAGLAPGQIGADAAAPKIVSTARAFATRPLRWRGHLRSTAGRYLRRGPTDRLFGRKRMTILTVKHVTTYNYATPVGLGEHRMMLRPRDSNDQRLLDATLQIEPRPHELRWIHDVFDNCVAIATFTGDTRRLRVENNLTLEHTFLEGPEFQMEDRARFYPFAYDSDEIPDLARLVERHYPDPARELDHWVRRFLRQGRPTETGALLMTLTYAIKEGLSYERRIAKGTRSPLQTLASGRGTCRDFAVLMMEAARTLGFAARFVSGYIYVPDRDIGESHLGGGSTHAWCQIYLPGAGWVEFDPTNGIVGSRDLIRVAVAREAHQAIPLHGSYFGEAADFEDMEVSVLVRQLPDRTPSTIQDRNAPQ
jgi:transglutaminase-like putative cysteine protease